MMSWKEIADRVSILEDKSMMGDKTHLSLDSEKHELIIYSKEKNKLYRPNATGFQFHSDDHFVRLIFGPYGSGKTSACCAEIVKRACEMPAWKNGVKKSRWAIVRNTTGELYSTTLQTWLNWYENLGVIYKRQKPLLTYVHTFNYNGEIVELELLFIPLDREDQLKKVKSMELTGVYLNELSEVPKGALSHFKGRINGRYPPKDEIPGGYWTGIIADTNPPDTDHWIYKTFEGQKEADYKIYHQPPGLIKSEDGIWIPNPSCDNYEHLDENYYTKMAAGETEEFVKVYCLGQYGSVIFGKRVYGDYNDDLHSKEMIEPIHGLPIHLGWDFGLDPAVVIVQFTPNGRFKVIKEFCGEDIGVRQFAKTVVKPYLNTVLAEFQVGYSVGDPSGSYGKDTDESTCLQILEEEGIPTIPAFSNSPIRRIESVKYYLNIMIEGRPAFEICKQKCPIVRKGFLGDYHYKRIRVIGEEKYQDVPNKNMASHPHDALQYIAMQFCWNKLEDKKGSPVDFYIPPMTL